MIVLRVLRFSGEGYSFALLDAAHVPCVCSEKSSVSSRLLTGTAVFPSAAM